MGWVRIGARGLGRSAAATAVHAVVPLIDIWGIYFIIALHAFRTVRPHVVGADGLLRLRSGVLTEVRIPARLIARVRPERRFPDASGSVQLREDGTLDIAAGSQTAVTVELTEPVRFVRPLGEEAEARTVRFYADDPPPAVAALTAGTNRTSDAPASWPRSRTTPRPYPAR